MQIFFSKMRNKIMENLYIPNFDIPKMVSYSYLFGLVTLTCKNGKVWYQGPKSLCILYVVMLLSGIKSFHTEKGELHYNSKIKKFVGEGRLFFKKKTKK